MESDIVKLPLVRDIRKWNRWLRAFRDDVNVAFSTVEQHSSRDPELSWCGRLRATDDAQPSCSYSSSQRSELASERSGRLGVVQHRYVHSHLGHSGPATSKFIVFGSRWVESPVYSLISIVELFQLAKLLVKTSKNSKKKANEIHSKVINKYVNRCNYSWRVASAMECFITEYVGDGSRRRCENLGPTERQQSRSIHRSTFNKGTFRANGSLVFHISVCFFIAIIFFGSFLEFIHSIKLLHLFNHTLVNYIR